MTNELQLDPRKRFVPRTLPWLLAAVMLVVYGLTLNHWVSLFNIGYVAKTSGWLWQPEVVSPLSFLATYPIRWLPTTLIPIALNFFSAVCAALTLGLLARSVAILPQDRTDAQRKREKSDFSFLTTGSAWLPPLLAVVVCGLQLTFWEQATNQTGETFDLLLFAFILWSLLEFRLDERVGRLTLAALVYGAAMTENWAMVAFLPVFIMALIWTRKLAFFNLGFLGRMTLCGLAGMSLYLLLPLIAVLNSKFPLSFWQALKVNLSAQWLVISAFFSQTEMRHTLGLLSLTSLLPVFVLAIRWSSSFGDRSQIGITLANFMFHIIHAVMLGVCVWVAFDPPFSPRHLGLGLPCLTLYYLGALAVGYYSGYFLLVFGREIASSRPPQRRKPGPSESMRLPIVLAVGAFSALAMVGLVYKNTPQIKATNDATFRHYAALVTKNLPHTGGYLLSDDPRRLVFVQAELVREGRSKEFVPLDTQSLIWPAYHRFLHERFSEKWPAIVSATQNNELNPMGLIAVFTLLSKTNDLYYLHPSFGYYFEQFYTEQHGLAYKLKILPNETLLPPLPDKKQIADNEAFWTKAAEENFAPIEQAAAPADPNAPQSFGEQLLTRFHVAREPNLNAITVGTYYSRDLDFWGVQLQRAGELPAAAARFATAGKLNPENLIARVNLQFNEDLRAGKTVPVDLSKTTADEFGKYRSWNAMIGANGPVDQPSFCFQDGLTMMQGGLMRQAVAPFERVRQLDPDNLAARFLLGQLYLASRLPDKALESLHDPLNDPKKFSLAETNSTQLNILAAGAYLQKNDNARAVQLLQTEISRHPADDELLFAVAKAYILHGLFPEALGVIDRKLKMTPDDPAWLFSRGYVSIQLKDYNAAVSAMTRVLSLQTNNYDARFNRAIAYLDSDKLDAARADYLVLQATFTNAPPVAYGLGEIAYRKHETNETVRNYQIYLANANTNTAEATNIIQRLHELQGQPH